MEKRDSKSSQDSRDAQRSSAHRAMLIATCSRHFKKQEISNTAVRNSPCTLLFVSGHLKTQEMCNEIVHIDPEAFFLISNRFKTQEMCEKSVEVVPWQLHYVSDYFKTQEICDDVVKIKPFCLMYVPDWFVKLKEIWYKDFVNDDEIVVWYEGYKKCKAEKAKKKKT